MGQSECVFVCICTVVCSCVCVCVCRHVHFTSTTCSCIFAFIFCFRIKELFEILVEFPDSKPSLDDLKDCLDRVELRTSLIKSLREM